MTLAARAPSYPSESLFPWPLRTRPSGCAFAPRCVRPPWFSKPASTFPEAPGRSTSMATLPIRRAPVGSDGADVKQADAWKLLIAELIGMAEPARVLHAHGRHIRIRLEHLRLRKSGGAQAPRHQAGIRIGDLGAQRRCAKAVVLRRQEIEIRRVILEMVSVVAGIGNIDHRVVGQLARNRQAQRPAKRDPWQPDRYTPLFVPGRRLARRRARAAAPTGRAVRWPGETDSRALCSRSTM